ncbi:unnamed protein product [Angiostrongylus costaricensis]|uniref:G_PROTEIN_RECEP_F1_2 domain-containing protein n=1 Tax=Angiostrongylus costaricensis TaxID=334426 RepID=A0A0R3PT87_ANGCS|nr:unnamed protein product [Angiostrongylus costaricensis]
MDDCVQRPLLLGKPKTRGSVPCGVLQSVSLRCSTCALLFFLVHLQNFQVTNFRRQRAIRRCLFMATVQMILNAPYYTLQLIDEVYSLQ